MSSDSKLRSTEVEIFGSLYHLQSADDTDHLQAMARKVDETMREIAGSVSTNDPSRIAILAGLNLANELYRCQRQHEGDRVELQERVAKVTGKLAKALDTDAT